MRELCEGEEKWVLRFLSFGVQRFFLEAPSDSSPAIVFTAIVEPVEEGNSLARFAPRTSPGKLAVRVDERAPYSIVWKFQCTR